MGQGAQAEVWELREVASIHYFSRPWLKKKTKKLCGLP